MDGWMDRKEMDGWMYINIKKQIDGWMDKKIDGLLMDKKDRWLDG